MLNKEKNVEECDATDDDSSTEACITIFILDFKELTNHKMILRTKSPL